MTDNNLVSADSATGQTVDLEAMHAQAMANAEEASKPSKFVSGYESKGPAATRTDADLAVDVASTKLVGSKFVAAGIQLAGTMSRNNTGFSMGQQPKNNMSAGSIMPMGYWDKRKAMKAERKAAAKEWRKNKGRGGKAAKSESVMARASIASQSVSGGPSGGKGSVKGAKITAKTVELCGTGAKYMALAAAIRRRMDQGEMGAIRHDSKKLPNSALNAYKQGNDKMDKHLKNFVPEIGPSLQAKKPRF